MSSTAEVASEGKWTGGVQDVLLDCPVEAAWELCSDWAHWQRWWPGNPTCKLREGKNRQPGCLRYVVLMPGVCNYERLLECDPENHFMSYCLEENQFAFKDYVAKAQFRATEEGKKTMVNWSYEVQPVEGYTAEMMATGMSTFYTTFLKDLEKGAQRLAKGLNPKPDDDETQP